MAILGAIVPWYGSKRRLADAVISLLGDHLDYYEPFCGSLAVLLAKPASRAEMANDLHGDLINLAWCLQDEGTAATIHGDLSRSLTDEGSYDRAVAAIRDTVPGGDRDVGRAIHYLRASWLGLNGTAGTAERSKIGGSAFCVRFASGGGSPATRFRSVADSIPQWHERLRNVVITRRDGFAMIERIPDLPTTGVYIDPPYFQKSARYQHDFSAGDHERLAGLLTRFARARVVVSYYDDPKLAALYPCARWHRRTCEMEKMMTHAGRIDGQRGVAPEVLLWNFEESAGLF